jgi:hypothetical protein
MDFWGAIIKKKSKTSFGIEQKTISKDSSTMSEEEIKLRDIYTKYIINSTKETASGKKIYHFSVDDVLRQPESLEKLSIKDIKDVFSYYIYYVPARNMDEVKGLIVDLERVPFDVKKHESGIKTPFDIAKLLNKISDVKKISFKHVQTAIRDNKKYFFPDIAPDKFIDIYNPNNFYTLVKNIIDDQKYINLFNAKTNDELNTFKTSLSLNSSGKESRYIPERKFDQTTTVKIEVENYIIYLKSLSLKQKTMIADFNSFKKFSFEEYNKILKASTELINFFKIEKIAFDDMMRKYDEKINSTKKNIINEFNRIKNLLEFDSFIKFTEIKENDKTKFLSAINDYKYLLSNGSTTIFPPKIKLKGMSGMDKKGGASITEEEAIAIFRTLENDVIDRKDIDSLITFIRDNPTSTSFTKFKTILRPTVDPLKFVLDYLKNRPDDLRLQINITFIEYVRPTFLKAPFSAELKSFLYDDTVFSSTSVSKKDNSAPKSILKLNSIELKKLADNYEEFYKEAKSIDPDLKKIFYDGTKYYYEDGSEAKPSDAFGWISTTKGSDVESAIEMYYRNKEEEKRKKATVNVLAIKPPPSPPTVMAPPVHK